MQEKKDWLGGSGFRPRRHQTRGTCQCPPTVRRGIARNGDRAAMHRRSEIDRSGGLGKPQECHAMRETTSPPSPRPPPQDDTLALRDRRGAWAGVAPDLRRVATRLPHHARVRVTTAGAVPCDRPAAGRACPPCFHARRRPVCPCPQARRTPTHPLAFGFYGTLAAMKNSEPTTRNLVLHRTRGERPHRPRRRGLAAGGPGRATSNHWARGRRRRLIQSRRNEFVTCDNCLPSGRGRMPRLG